MNLIDILEVYDMKHGDGDDNLFLMLQDYPLDNRINRENMNKIILKELGSMRPFTTNTTVFKFALDEFFMKYQHNIGKLLDTMYFEYNPLYSKDITRTLTETEDKVKVESEDKAKTETEDNTKTGTENKSLSETEHRESTADIDNTDTYTTTTDTDIDYTTENQVSAMDSVTYQPKDKTIHDETQNVSASHSGTTTSDITSDVDTTKTITETNRTGETEDNERTVTEDNSKNITEDNDRTEEERITGKDNDTSYQELITQERELAEFNIFNWIIKLMRKELFLLVY